MLSLCLCLCLCLSLSVSVCLCLSLLVSVCLLRRSTNFFRKTSHASVFCILWLLFEIFGSHLTLLLPRASRHKRLHPRSSAAVHVPSWTISSGNRKLLLSSKHNSVQHNSQARFHMFSSSKHVYFDHVGVVHTKLVQHLKRPFSSPRNHSNVRQFAPDRLSSHLYFGPRPPKT